MVGSCCDRTGFVRNQLLNIRGNEIRDVVKFFVQSTLVFPELTFPCDEALLAKRKVTLA